MKINGETCKMVDLENIGNIKELRKAKKLSQENVARYCGVSLQAYQRWEREITRKIPEQRYHRLVEILNGNVSV